MRKSYIKTPAQKLAENQIDIAQATLESESNGFVQGLNLLGGLAQQVGSSMLTKGATSNTGNFFSDNAMNFNSLLSGLSPMLYADGGIVGEEDGGIFEAIQKLSKGVARRVENSMLTDRSKAKNFNTAYSEARKNGEPKFKYKGKIYNTNYNGTPEEQLKQTGITDDQIHDRDFIEKNLANNINPYNYTNIFNGAKAVSSIVTGKSNTRKYFDKRAEIDKDRRSQNRADALSMYTGTPQKYNTFSVSKNRPDNSTNKDAIYYSINPDSENGIIDSILTRVGYENNKPFIKEAGYPRKEGADLGNSDKELDKKIETDIPANIMGRFTIGTGKDDKGDYVSYYDKWDIDPVNFGKPFEIYDRIYIDRDKKGNVIKKDMKKKYANGGIVNNKTVEVEGDEVAEMPNGQVLEFKGPTHEQGGINTALPPGTEIFSDRIKIDNQTMAERKMKREKKEKKFQGTDAISKSTLERLKKYNALQDEKDMTLQQLISLAKGEKKFAYGGQVGGIQDFLTMLQGGQSLNPYYGDIDINQSNLNVADSTGQPTIPSTLKPTNLNIGKATNLGVEDTNSKAGFNLPNLTVGDGLGMFGNAFQAISAYQNTLANRATDNPNINPYENFGLDALETNARAMDVAGQIRDKQLQDLELNRSALSSQNRAGARGINTMRALDLAGSIASNKAEGDINNAFAGQLLSLLGQQSQLENTRDNAVMSGEAARDLADRQDKDNFYTNRGTNLVDIGRSISQTGKSLNDIQTRDTQAELLNQLFNYIGFDPMTGQIYQKDGVSISGGKAATTPVVKNKKK